jgi:hypothetical protein
VIDVPGLTPRSPVTMVGPVLVTVEAPRMAKVWSVPSCGGPWEKATWDEVATRIAAKQRAILVNRLWMVCVRVEDIFMFSLLDLQRSNPALERMVCGA